jgi:tetratricopeptide (TPR) repeat protein
MDDILYYVESPEGEILGPMSMMHVMEGIAEGAILETALVCEVGAQEWVPLSDLAFSREDAGVPSGAVPAEPEVEEVEVVEHFIREQPMLDALSDAGPPRSSPFPTASEPARPRAEFIDARSEPPARPQPELPVRRQPEPAAFEEPHEEPGFDLPAEDPFESETTSHAGAGEWSTESEEELVPAAREGGRPRWILPVAAAAAVPLIGVVFWAVAGHFAKPDRATEPTMAADAPGSAMQAAKDLLDAGRAKEALAAYQRIAGEEPENASAHRGAGQAALLAGDAELAVEHLEKACELRDDRPVWLTDLAEALHASGRAESAIQKLAAYLEDHPEDLAWQQIRLEWMLAGGRDADAERVYEALAGANPDGAFEQYLAGLAARDEGRAEKYLRRSIELDSSNADAHVALARALAVHGETAGAIASLERAFEVRPGTPEEQAFLASLQKARAEATAKPKEPEVVAKATPPAKPAESAKPKASAPAKPAPATSETLSDRLANVRAALAEERFADAKDALARARNELGGSAEVQRNVALWEGIVAFEEERFPDALRAFESLDADASYRAGGWGTGSVANWIARVHFATGDVRKAVAALDAVGPTDPDEYAVARLWEGIALASLGMGDLASRTWERIPEDVGARVAGPGKAAVKSAELLVGAISEKDYRTAVQPVRDFQNDMHFFLALAARRKDDAEAARQHFAEAIESSAGREFPYHVARAEMSGEGKLAR